MNLKYSSLVTMLMASLVSAFAPSSTASISSTQIYGLADDDIISAIERDVSITSALILQAVPSWFMGFRPDLWAYILFIVDVKRFNTTSSYVVCSSDLV